jgi:EAL domain-containing protein (putative c-di-GMP-specific phosphodiesterase class I)
MVKLSEVATAESPLVEAAHARGLTIGVEGINTPDDDRRARAAGCEIGEGAFYGDATDPSHLLAKLADLRLG